MLPYLGGCMFEVLEQKRNFYIFFQKYLICPITTVFEKISISDTNQKQQKIGPVGDSPWCVDAVYQVWAHLLQVLQS